MSSTKKGFGLTITDVRRMACEFAAKNITSPLKLFNSDKRQAGWDWYSGFMKRNPELSVRSAQNISYARAECMIKSLCYVIL